MKASVWLDYDLGWNASNIFESGEMLKGCDPLVLLTNLDSGSQDLGTWRRKSISRPSNHLGDLEDHHNNPRSQK